MREAFFAVFKKIKKRLARAKAGSRFYYILFILLVTQLVLRIDTIPNRPYFKYKRLFALSSIAYSGRAQILAKYSRCPILQVFGHERLLFSSTASTCFYTTNTITTDVLSFAQFYLV